MPDNMLDRINSPDDMKQLNRKEIKLLCEEIRTELIETVAKNGGHLASNLGVVELTVAIHKAFDSPKDKIVFDVGHQCYTHKILTGRREAFKTLRTEGGLAGFPRPSESVHDSFVAGHSSTSISAGFGISQAKQIKKEEGYVIIVIGDGALTGGLAYEALNNAGRTQDKIIVILNDNKMSISQNVGAMAKYLARIRSKPTYYKFKSTVERGIRHIPFIGKKLRDMIFFSKSILKNAIYHSTIFEDMGFSYLGPVDGHDINTLLSVLDIAKRQERPVLLHVDTIKGKGYSFAEENPKDFHGVNGFDIQTGDYFSSVNSFSYIFGDYLCEMAKRDDRICAITAAMKSSTGLKKFSMDYPSRFFDVGIAEQHAVTFAGGLAISGLVPFFAVYSSFLQRSYDQLIHDIAIQNLKCVIGIDRAGLVGEDGETHQGLFDVAFLNSIPNISVYSPCTYDELMYDIKAAIYKDSGPVAIRYPRGSQPCLPKDYTSYDLPYIVYGDETAKITIVTYGRLFSSAVKAMKRLEEQNITVNILKLNKIKPVDQDAVNQILSSSHIFFFEEGMAIGGVSEHFTALLAQKRYKGAVSITAVDNIFVPQATVERSLELLGLDAAGMTKKILEETSLEEQSKA